MSTTLQTKINPLSKVLFKVQDYKNKTLKPNILDPLEQKITQEIHKIQVNSFINEAKKAEFKGNIKKALDKYYEALYFLKTDKIDDAKQQETILAIENGKYNPSLELAFKMALYFETTIEKIFHYKEKRG